MVFRLITMHKKEEIEMLMLLQMIDHQEEKRKFVIIYEKYRYLMLKVAKDVLNDQYLAEDAVHEAFVKVANNIDKIGAVGDRATKRYLIVITKNVAIDIYRKRHQQMEKEIFMEKLEEREDVSYMETDIDNQVLDILKNLPEKYRDIFLLKYSNDFENREIAQILGLTEGNVRQRIARGKVLIQEALEQLGGQC